MNEHDPVRLPSLDTPIVPVTIFDAEGRVVRVVSAADFRRAHPRPAGGRSQGPVRRRTV